ncbi:MAG TPA: hypothetical protein VGD71_36935 [Kribbella sp.]|jgi:alkanesulfonate monooxygenase SsuD/methylene tetrahydromethanopterin reductase-like flavin-dependent oxidoreductase (luciferase family)
MTFHLVASLMTPGHFRSAWRLSQADRHAYLNIDNFRGLARIADETGLDAIFLGDAPAVGHEIAVRRPRSRRRPHPAGQAVTVGRFTW